MTSIPYLPSGVALTAPDHSEYVAPSPPHSHDILLLLTLSGAFLSFVVFVGAQWEGPH